MAAAKKFTVFKNGEANFNGEYIILNPDRVKNMRQFLMLLSDRLKLSVGPVTTVYTLDGKILKDITEIEDKEYYVAGGGNLPLKKLAYVAKRDDIKDSYVDPVTMQAITKARTTVISPTKKMLSPGKEDVDPEPDENDSKTEATEDGGALDSSTDRSKASPPPGTSKGPSPSSPGQEKNASTSRQKSLVGEKAKIIYVFRNGDPKWEGDKIVVNIQKYRTWPKFLIELQTRVKCPTNQVSKVYTAISYKPISSFDELQDGGQYICCGPEPLEKLNYKVVGN